MAYDFDGPWENTTGLVAPSARAKGDPDTANNALSAVAGYLAGGVRPEKIVLGMPFYGYEWTGVPDVDNGLWQAGTPGNSAGYNQIAPLVKKSQLFRDQITLAPWLYDGTTFWTYDDAESLGYKARLADRLKLGGAMAWDLSGDMPDGMLDDVGGGLGEGFAALHHEVEGDSAGGDGSPKKESAHSRGCSFLAARVG